MTNIGRLAIFLAFLLAGFFLFLSEALTSLKEDPVLGLGIQLREIGREIKRGLGYFKDYYNE